MTNHRKKRTFIFVSLFFRTMDVNSDYNVLQRMYSDDSVTKFGYAFYLSSFFRNILELRQRFDRITLKKVAKPYTVSDFCMGISLAISVGCCPFSKIDTELYEERKLARSLGLEEGFFSASQAHRILNMFTGHHVNQLRRIGQTLVKQFGDGPQKNVIIVDIDQSVRPTYANKREGATTGKTVKHGQKCLQWSVAFCAGEVIDHQLKAGYRHCIDDFKERYTQARQILGRIDILRIDGGYLSATNLNLLGEQQRICTKASVNLTCVKEGLQMAQGHYWKHVDSHTKLFDCGWMTIFPNVPHHYRLILVKGQRRQEKRIPKRQRSTGRGYRAYRITYRDILFGILTNIPGKPLQIYQFYKERQTIENYFRDSYWSFETGKLPSQFFRANQAYLWLVSLVQNALVWFQRQCLPPQWHTCSYRTIRDELINRKALVTEHSDFVSINFSRYFKYPDVHHAAATRLERMKTAIEQGEPLEAYWAFSSLPSATERFLVE